MSGPNDSAAGAGPGPGGRGWDRLHRPVQRQGNRQDEGEDQEALRHRAQQAPGPAEHNGTRLKTNTAAFRCVWIFITPDHFNFMHSLCPTELLGWKSLETAFRWLHLSTETSDEWYSFSSSSVRMSHSHPHVSRYFEQLYWSWRSFVI